MQASASRPYRIGVVAYDGSFAAEIFGFTDLLLIANRVATQSGAAERDPFKITVVGSSTSVTLAGGSTLGTKQWHGRFDMVVVPGFELVLGAALDRRLGHLRPEADYVAALAARGVPVASICVGAFVLGEAGLLDGRRVTTAWLFAPELTQRYPDADVRPSSLVEEDGNVTTMAAFSSCHDLALRVVRRHLGPEIARVTARIALVAANRHSQGPFIDESLTPVFTDQFSADIERWLVDRLAEPYELATLAAAFNVSTRTLLRRYRAEAGTTPLEFLQGQRMRVAQRLLETTDTTLTEIMRSVGYLDPGTFRRLFLATVGCTPADYRRQFRSNVDAANF